MKFLLMIQTGSFHVLSTVLGLQVYSFGLQVDCSRLRVDCSGLRVVCSGLRVDCAELRVYVHYCVSLATSFQKAKVENKVSINE